MFDFYISKKKMKRVIGLVTVLVASTETVMWAKRKKIRLEVSVG